MFVQSVMFFDGVPALARASRHVGQMYGMTSGKKGSYASDLTNIARSYVDVLEKAIAKATHSHQIPERSNWGLQPDLLTIRGSETSTSEIKNSVLQYMRDTSGIMNITRARDIRLGSSVKISAGSRGLTTGYKADGTPIDTEFSDADSFFNKYKGNPKKLVADLKNPHGNLKPSHQQALSLIKSNMFLKARELNIPFMVNDRTLANINMRFNVNDILQYANASLNKAGDKINIDFKFSSSLLQEAFTKINNDPSVRSMLDTTSQKLINKIDIELQSATIDSLSRTLMQAEQELNGLSIAMHINYEKGSVVAYKGSVKFIRQAQKAEDDLGILDLTQFVQGRVRLRMRRGLGDPRPPNIYYRSGTFKNNIDAYYNFKNETAIYYYIPHYDGLQRYGYRITELVEGSVRDIVKERLNREAKIIRASKPRNR